MDYFVLTENDESNWNDQAGIRYHFPHKYFNLLQAGAKIIYYKGRMRKKEFARKRLSEKPHYFGLATIDQITDNRDKTYNASFKDFQLFSKPVPFKIDGRYLERIPDSKKDNYWRDGVRPIDLSIYDNIVKLAGITPNKSESIFNDVELATGGTPVYMEGGQKKVIVTQYERNQGLRDKAIEIHGYSCSACGFNFGEIYGEWGNGFIHIHHLNPVAQNADIKEINPETDLVPLCANCHAMVHRRIDRVLSMEELAKTRER